MPEVKINRGVSHWFIPVEPCSGKLPRFHRKFKSVLLLSMLIKGAVRVRVSVRRVLVELAAYAPFAAQLRQIVQQLVSAHPQPLG